MHLAVREKSVTGFFFELFQPLLQAGQRLFAGFRADDIEKLPRILSQIKELIAPGSFLIIDVFEVFCPDGRNAGNRDRKDRKMFIKEGVPSFKRRIP